MTKKGQQYSLSNSQGTEACADQVNNLYHIVTKNLKDELCSQHQQKVQYFYQKQLMCHNCLCLAIPKEGESSVKSVIQKYEFYYHLETILNHPIVLVIEESELLSHPIQMMRLILSSYKQLYQKKSSFKIQRQLIDSFVSKVKDKIDKLCSEILDNYTKMEQSIRRHVDLKEDMKNINKMYEEQLMDMLGEKFVEGSKGELENILSQYLGQNENPLTSILTNLDEFMNQVARSPLIDTKLLENIYTTVTDEMVWRTDKVIRTIDDLKNKQYQTAELIINSDEVRLQGEYTLTSSQNELTLAIDDKSISHLTVQIDSLYKLPNYKLLGVNYDQIVILDYFQGLSIEKQFSLPGCTDLLPFPYHIIAISNGDLLKISLDTASYERLGRNYKNLKYSDKDSLNFMCENQKDEMVTWNCYPQFMTHIVS